MSFGYRQWFYLSVLGFWLRALLNRRVLPLAFLFFFFSLGFSRQTGLWYLENDLVF